LANDENNDVTGPALVTDGARATGSATCDAFPDLQRFAQRRLLGEKSRVTASAFAVISK
jgi:hypothetical protein